MNETQPYSDFDGENQPDVTADQAPSFAAFINAEDEIGLDMTAVTGICCETVHPLIHKAVAEMDQFAVKLNVEPDQFLTRLQAQIVQCLGGDITRSFFTANPQAVNHNGMIRADAGALMQLVTYSMQTMLLVYKHIAPDFDDDKALVAATMMKDWIETTHADDLPFFWSEIVEILHGYENMDLDDLDDFTNK